MIARERRPRPAGPAAGRARPLLLPAPSGFSWRRTILSHGWVALPPFELDRERWRLSRVLDLGEEVVRASLAWGPGGTIEVRGVPVRGPGRDLALGQVSRMLGFGDGLEDFYARADRERDFEWIRPAGAGRLLRSPSVFEDLVKTICTTNCSWSLTRSMVARLVESAGRLARGAETGAGPRSRAFPRAVDLAGRSERFFRAEVRAGYRSEALRRLSDDVAAGRLDVEAWDRSGLGTPELKRLILGVRGVGPYAAENLLRLLGRFDGLALDSWCRREFAAKHRKGRPASDRVIARRYERFGHWRGLALWCDLTRDWLEGEDPDAVEPGQRVKEGKWS